MKILDRYIRLHVAGGYLLIMLILITLFTFLDFVEQLGAGDGKETAVEAVRRRFGVTINPRSIERALRRRKKKPPTKLETQG